MTRCSLLRGLWGPCLLLVVGCNKSETSVPPPVPSEVLTTLDGLFHPEGDNPLRWKAHLTGNVQHPPLPEGFEPIARGYLSVRIDLPLPSGAMLPVAGVFAPDPSGDRLQDAAPLSSFPRSFPDDRLQLRAELARRLAVAPASVPTFPGDFAAALGANGATLPLLDPPESACARALDPQVACASDEALVKPLGLEATFEVSRMRSYGHEVSPDLAADLVLGQHPSEQKWELAVTIPSPDGAPSESHVWHPVVLARVHAKLSAVSASGLDQQADLFGPIDTWGWVALSRLPSPPALTEADKVRFATNAEILGQENALPVAEGDFSIETVEVISTVLSGCL